MKCAIFASSGGVPTTVLGTANVVNNPGVGAVALTFPTPVAVTRGIQYWMGCVTDFGPQWNSNNTNTGLNSATTYAAFPVASPVTTSGFLLGIFTYTIAVTTNYPMVSEAQQDGSTSYVYDSTPGHADLYGLAALPALPANVIAVTTRGFVQKSDAGTRGMALQLKSGVATVQSPSTILPSSFNWLWRIDTLDPATGVAWTPLAVETVQIGPVITA
jgi:hypothetical protein